MTLEEKIQFIIDNEGCEGADGFSGLQTFFRYVCPDNLQDKILALLDNEITSWYNQVLEEEEERNSYLTSVEELGPGVNIIRYNDVAYVMVNGKIFNSLGKEVAISPKQKVELIYL